MPVVGSSEFPGTDQEALDLLEAVGHNCTCSAPDDKPLSVCATHRMLTHEPRAINGLVFARRMVERLLLEEWRSK
jgi:hypothetical protein